MKTALITGITGQDGSYLAEFLLDKGYIVHGIKRRSSSFNTARIDHIFDNPNLTLHYGDLTDTASLISILQKTKPDEVYNLGAQSHVRVSFDIPEYTGDVVGMGAVRLLEALNILGMHKVRYYQASSSEMFGLVQEIPQKETTPFYPRSPYGCAKVYAYWITRNYRDSYGMHASNGILFNHESPVRGETFVTQKVVQAAVNISKGKQKMLSLGNLDAQRDWGHAKDYVEAQWLILQQDEPDDYVISTGKMFSVRKLVELSFEYLGMEIKWYGEGLREVGMVGTDPVVNIDPQYFRPAEVDELLGDCTKAKTKLGWTQKYTFESMIKEMVEVELAR